MCLGFAAAQPSFLHWEFVLAQLSLVPVSLLHLWHCKVQWKKVVRNLEGLWKPSL